MNRTLVLERSHAPAAILCAAILAASGAAPAEAKDGDRAKPKAASAETDKSKEAKTAPAPKSAESKPQPGGDGMRAFVDPKTGELREPTEEDLAAIAAQSLAASRRATPKRLEAVRHPNGMLSVDLTGSEYIDFTVLTVNPDGTLSRRCVKGAAEASKAAEETAPAALEWK